MANTRRNTAALWVAANPTLRSGEIGIEKDTKKQKIGDGVTSWVNLPYQFNKAMADASYAPVSGSANYLTLDSESRVPQSNLPEHLTVAELSAMILDVGSNVFVRIPPPPPGLVELLGAAGTYSVLAWTMVTSTGATTLDRDLGVSPGTAITGFPPGTVVGATRTGPDAASAQSSLLSTYDAALSLTPDGQFTGDNNGRTYLPGVYHTAAAFALTGTMTLDGGGDPDAIFVFQVDAALNTAAASQISLINGASAVNVFWQVAGAVGTGASAVFVGTIMSLAAITLGAGTTLAGRALSRADVTLSGNTFTTVTG